MLGKLAYGLVIAFAVVVLTAVAVVAPLGLLSAGAYRAWDQDRQVRNGVPATATVLRSETETRESGSGARKRRTWVALFRYRYQVDGRDYEYDRITPLGYHSSSAAFDVVHQHPVGTTCPIYYVSDDPTRAYVLRTYNVEPYLLYFFGLGLTAMVLSFGTAFLVVRERAAVGVAVPLSPGWALLAPRRSVRTRARVYLVQGPVLLALAWLGGWHMFYRYPDVDRTIASIVLAAFTLWGMVFVVLGLRAALTRGAVADARVTVEADRLRPGGAAGVRVEQLIRRPAAITEVRIGLVCTQQLGSGKSTRFVKHWETWLALPAPRSDVLADGRRAMVVEGTLVVPPDQPPSHPVPGGGHDTFSWAVEVVTVLAGLPDYRAQFDVTVRGVANAA